MMGTSHLTVAEAVAITAPLALHNPALVLPCAVAAAIGGLAPDLDSDGSMGSNAPEILARPWLRALGRRRGIVATAAWALATAVVWTATRATRLLSWLVRLLSGGHRARTHSLWTLAVLSVIAALLCLVAGMPPAWAWGFTVGYLSHILADACTRSGTPAPFPTRAKRLWLLPYGHRLRTGSGGETAVVAVLVIATAVLWIGVFGAELGPAAVDAGRTIAMSPLWPALWHVGVELYGRIISSLPRPH